MRWTPQRSLEIALGVAAIGVLACLAVAVFDRRRRPWVSRIDSPILHHPRAGVRTARTSMIAAGALVLIAALTVSPSWGVWAIPVAAALVVSRRPRLAVWAGAALAAALGLVVVRRQYAFEYLADAGWPGRFDDLHRAGVFVVVLVLAGCLLDPERPASRSDEPLDVGFDLGAGTASLEE